MSHQRHDFGIFALAYGQVSSISGSAPKCLIPVSDRVCVLVAGVADDFAAGLRAHRPDWTVASLGAGDWQPAAGSPQHRVFALVGWLLPAMSGLELCRRLRDRGETANVHITMVLDPADPAARSRALAAGADDYTLAPLDIDVMIARIEDLARSRQSAVPAWRSGQTLAHRGLEVDPVAFMVRHADRAVRLRRNEFDILMHFMRRPNQVLSRAALVDQIGKGGMIGERTVDRRIARLRKTLCDHAIEDPIRTVYGVGYVFDTVD